MAGVEVELLREGEGTLGDLALLLQPNMEQTRHGSTRLHSGNVSQWNGACATVSLPSSLADTEQEPPASLGLSTPSVRACESTQPLPRASLRRAPSLFHVGLLASLRALERCLPLLQGFRQQGGPAGALNVNPIWPITGEGL